MAATSLLIGCAEAGSGDHGATDDALSDELSGESSGKSSGETGEPIAVPFTTYGVDGWLERCREGEGTPDASLCEHLFDRPADLVAFLLNVDASRRGALPKGLDELAAHAAQFRHRTLSEWADEVRTALDSGELAGRPELTELARLVNRNYHRGRIDRGALAPVEEVSICGTDERVRGPAGSACASVGGECVRAVLDPDARCCRFAARPSGALCGEGSGLCNGQGGCVPRGPGIEAGASTDDLGTSAATEIAPLKDLSFEDLAGRLAGTDHAIDTVDGSSVRLAVRDDRLALRTESGALVELFDDPASNDPLVLSDVHVLESDGQGVHAVGVALGRGARVRVTRRVLHLPRDGRREATVCLHPDTGVMPSSISSDCTSPGSQRLACPGETQGGEIPGATCRVGDDSFEIESANALIAWPMTNQRPRDLVPLIFRGVCLFPPCSRRPSECRPGQRNVCVRPSCGVSFQRCSILGQWGPCEWPIEECDGADNDCDGSVDEGRIAECDDGLPCNHDACGFRLDPEFGLLKSCVHEDLCEPSAGCEESLCRATRPVTDRGDRAVPDETDLGCWSIRHDRYCRDTWDGCNCNGVELCEPDDAHADPESGCVSASEPPCESDDSKCTIELCCETNPACRTGTTPGLSVGPGTVECTDLPGDPQPRSPGDSVEVWCPDTPAVTVLGVSVSTVFDKFREPVSLGGCVDGEPLCNHDVCDPETGACSHPNAREGRACGERVTADMCGVFLCESGECQERPNLDAVEIDCPAAGPFPGPDRFTPEYFREPMHMVGEQVRYVAGEFSHPSCHRAACTSSGCGVTVDNELCPDSFGCRRVSCEFATSMNAGGIIGCRVQLNTGICELTLPEDNVCLVAECRENGSCHRIPDRSLCPRTLTCDEDENYVVTCHTGTGQCLESCLESPI